MASPAIRCAHGRHGLCGVRGTAYAGTQSTHRQMVFKHLSNDLVGFARGRQKSYRQIFEKDNGKWSISFRLDAAGDVTFSSNDVADAYRDLGDMIHNGIGYLARVAPISKA